MQRSYTIVLSSLACLFRCPVCKDGMPLDLLDFACFDKVKPQKKFGKKKPTERFNRKHLHNQKKKKEKKPEGNKSL